MFYFITELRNLVLYPSNNIFTIFGCNLINILSFSEAYQPWLTIGLENHHVCGDSAPCLKPVHLGKRCLSVCPSVQIFYSFPVCLSILSIYLSICCCICIYLEMIQMLVCVALILGVWSPLPKEQAKLLSGKFRDRTVD